MGPIEISSKHEFVQGKGGQKLSSLLKEKLVFIGQLDSYERGSVIAEKLMRIQTNDTCIYRITDEVGECSSDWLEEKQSLSEDSPESEKSVLNIQVDGSFLSTRKLGWKEVKLGRIYKSSEVESVDNQDLMSNSEYLSHFGNCEKFAKKMDRLIGTREKDKTELVFVNDGAEWIKNWINRQYPDAVEILDYYHAMEHICDFLECQYEQEEERENMNEYWGYILKYEG